MASNALLPKAEAKVVVRMPGVSDWRDALDFDPIEIPVESLETTDVFDAGVMTIVEKIIEAETDTNLLSLEYSLVWSETGHAVKGVCPMCDDVFPVSEGFTHDLPDLADLMSGVTAVVCGCVDN